GEARRRRAHEARVRRDAVDLGGREAGVGDGAQRGLDGQVHVGAEEAAADCRLPDAGEDGAPLEAFLGRHATRGAQQHLGGVRALLRRVGGGTERGGGGGGGLHGL